MINLDPELAAAPDWGVPSMFGETRSAGLQLACRVARAAAPAARGPTLARGQDLTRRGALAIICAVGTTASNRFTQAKEFGMTTADQAAPPKERRSAYRMETSIQGKIEGQQELGCRVVNLSSSGALAISPHAIPEFSEVKIRLMIGPEGEEPQEMICQAAVVRCSLRADGRHDIGLFFTGLDYEQSQRLREICDD